MSDYSLDFPRAFGGPVAMADLRLSNSDFKVWEQLGFEPSGSGEHVFLHIEKSGDNTEWLARQIARLAGVESRDVGYCGLKDRHAITSQWFSVYLPKGSEPDWTLLNSESVRLLAHTRHQQKLRRGQHQANRFEIWLRNLSPLNENLTNTDACTIDASTQAGHSNAELTAELATNTIERILAVIASEGVPNYFGEQRFGIDAGNLDAAERMLVQQKPIKNRSKKSITLSAARSWLFNQVLSLRVSDGNWCEAMPGDVLEAGLPTGPMWGRGRLASTEQALALETEVLSPWHSWCEPMEFTGLKQERRQLVSKVTNLQWQWQQGDLQLAFDLGVGAYATAVIREIIQPRPSVELKVES